jgi:hypothetical protein
MIMTRLVADICFTNMRGALDELEEAGCEVVISQEIIDIFSGAAFMEAYIDVCAGESDALVILDQTTSVTLDELASVMLFQIDALVTPFHGICVAVTPVSPPYLHVPFQEYKEHGNGHTLKKACGQ